MRLKKEKNTQETPTAKKSKEIKFTEKDAEKALASNKEQAKELLRNEKKMNDFLSQLDSKLNAVAGLKEKFAEIPIIVSLIRAHIKGEYREFPLGTLIALVSALIYFVSPVDIIPDFIPGIGYLDDFMVLGIALRFAYTDLEDYKKWLAENDQDNA